VTAPGHALFTALRAALGTVPVIAEDLGVITPDVEALRDAFGFPGMRVLHFAFGGEANHAFLPHNYVPNCVAYTGTHDNDTSRGWAAHADARERERARTYLECDDAALPWAMVRAVLASVARLAVVPMQDVLGLGSEHRMNTPGQLDCWRWRFQWDQVGTTGERMARYARAYGRGG
jgi:4-alpha-glucanotransferase